MWQTLLILCSSVWNLHGRDTAAVLQCSGEYVSPPRSGAAKPRSPLAIIQMSDFFDLQDVDFSPSISLRLMSRQLASG